MKTKILLGLLLIAGLVSPNAHARDGGAEGNGSGAFECINNGAIYYEFVDLWEAEQPFLQSRRGVKIIRSNTPTAIQILEALGKLQKSNPTLLYPKVLAAKKVIAGLDRHGDKVVQPMSPLASPPDLKTIGGKKGCEAVPVGAARWDPAREKLFVDPEVVNNFRSKTDEAAMWMHEFVLAALVDIEPTLPSSFAARQIVGYLFSDVEPGSYPFRENHIFFVKTRLGYSDSTYVRPLMQPFANPSYFNVEFNLAEGFECKSGRVLVGDQVLEVGAQNAVRIDPKTSSIRLATALDDPAPAAYNIKCSGPTTISVYQKSQKTLIYRETYEHEPYYHGHHPSPQPLAFSEIPIEEAALIMARDY